MKTVIFSLVALTLSTAAFAERIDRNSVVSVRACSSYLLTGDPDTHAYSAAGNFRRKAAAKCLAVGYTEWETLEWESTPGINVPVYCYHGTVQCK